MAVTVEMPKLSDTMEEGVLSAWLVEEGEEVAAGDVIAQVETDKATMDLEAFDDGVLLKKVIDEGDSVPIGALIAVIGEEDEDISDILAEAGGDGAAASEAETAADEAEAETDEAETAAESTATETGTPPAGDGQVSERAPEPVPAGTDAEGRRIKASPLARSMAKAHELELSAIEGTGPQGRIIKRDIENFREDKAVSPTGPAVATRSAVGEESYREENVSQMRKTIARRLSESKFEAPHFYLTVEIDMDNAMQARKMVNENSDLKISFNDMVIKAAAVALRQHPQVNSSWQGDTIRYNDHVHVGVAVAVDEGLLVPVVRFADGKTMSQINGEVKEYAEKARNKKLQPQDWEGNTFTISNLGMFGIEEFTAIINPPDSCIMAIGGIMQKPVVKNGEVVPGNTMKVTMSCDHRVVDGVTGAKFLDTFKKMMENPVMMIA